MFWGFKGGPPMRRAAWVDYPSPGESAYVWIDNANIIFTHHSQGLGTCAHFNIHRNKATELDLPAGMYSMVTAGGGDGKRFCVAFTNYLTRGQIQLISLEGEDTKRVVSVQILANSGLKIPSTLADRFTSPVPVTYPSEPVAHGLLYINNKTKPSGNAPTIIWAHGGPTAMISHIFSFYAQYFASRGYVFFAANYRGSIGYGKEYREALNGNWGTLDTIDIVNAAKYLIEQGLADPNRIIVMGGSAGGFATLNSLIRAPEVFAAGVDLCGVADNFLITQKTHLLESRYNEMLIGPLADLKKYKNASPVFYADKIVVPILILQGENDTVVVKEHSRTIRDRAKNSPYVEYHEYAGEGHMLLSTPTKLDLLPRVENFLRKWVLPK